MKKLLALILFSLFIYCSNCYSQNIDIKDIQYRDNFHLTRISDNDFRFIYKIKSNNNGKSLFRKIDFNTRLALKDTTVITLSGDYDILATTTNESYTASVFGSKQLGKLVIHFIDNETENQALYDLRLIGSWTRRARNEVKIVSSPEGDSFFVLYPHEKNVWEVINVDLQGKDRWRKVISDPRYKIRVDRMELLDEEHLSLLVSKNFTSRKVWNEVDIIDPSSGATLSVVPLYNDKSKSTVDNVFRLDSSIYWTGRTFFSNRISNQTTGLPYLKELIGDTGNDLKLPALTPYTKVFWMDLLRDDVGNRYLIGETFTNEPRGSYFMKGMITGLFTLGMVTVTWTSMKFEKVAIVSLDKPGAKQLHQLSIANRSIQLGNYTPGYTFAQYAYNTGQVRYWGHDGSGNIFLQDGTSIKKYNVSNRNIIEIGKLPDKSSQIVLYTSDDYLVYLNLRKLNNQVEFKVMPLKKLS